MTHTDFMTLEAVVVDIRAEGGKILLKNNPTTTWTDELRRESAMATAYYALGLLAKLRWKATRKLLTPAPLGPNKNRAKRGLPLIAERYTITIELGKDGVTLGEQGGTHASPKPHWRRAHTRTLASGLVVPVREARVGFDDDPRWDVSRKRYEVKAA
jgi:hypothetical protein